MSVHYLPTYKHIDANATTTLKNGPGALIRVTINTKGATGNTLTLYDNTSGSGPVIAVIDTTTGVGSINFDEANFDTGLTAVMANGTAADVTVVFA